MKINNLMQIKECLLKHKPEIERRYHVHELGIFGSIVRGEQTAESDIDILVDYQKTPGLFEFVELKDFLSDILHQKVDLVMKDSLKLHIGKKILEEVVIL